MFLISVAKDDDVIDVNENEIPTIIVKNLVDAALKEGESIFQAKWYLEIFPQTIVLSYEGC